MPLSPSPIITAQQVRRYLLGLTPYLDRALGEDQAPGLQLYRATIRINLKN